VSTRLLIAGSVFADSLREAFVRSGHNLAQSIVLLAIDCARRGWRYFGWRW
jgi:hypothetical protein